MSNRRPKGNQQPEENITENVKETPEVVSDSVNVLPDIIADVIESKPRADDNVDQLITEQTAEAAPQTEAGNYTAFSTPVSQTFDPAIHSIGEDGKPRLNKDGTYRKKRGPKVGGSTIGSAAPTPSPSVSARTAAVVTVQSLLTICVAIGGDEWRPIKDDTLGVDEHRSLIEAWEAYYVTSGVTNIPPWVIVVVSMGTYAGQRFAMPKTQTRLGILWGWVKGKFGWE